jgi:hypothetical protein
MPVETNLLIEPSADSANFWYTIPVNIDASETAAALAPVSGAYPVVDNLSIAVLEMLAQHFVCHSYKTPSLRHAYLFVAYLEALPSKEFSR